jgi:hypothetical protein
MAKFFLLSVLIVFCQIFQLNATISDSFQCYVKEKFGEDALEMVARTDFGLGGSFGGGNHIAGNKTK